MPDDRQIRLKKHIRDRQLQATVHEGITTHLLPRAPNEPQIYERWKHIEILGHGGGGIVYLDRNVEGYNIGELRAVKCISMGDDENVDQQHLRELEALVEFAQGNWKYQNFFVTFYGWFTWSRKLYIAMEYCNHLDLGTYLKRHKHLPESEVQDIAWQVLQGLRLMHDENFAHRDLKPANILIKAKPPKNPWWVKICDLGLSKSSDAAAATTTVYGTPGFMAPEALIGNKNKIDPFAADIWSLGQTVSQALTGRVMFTTDSLKGYRRGRLPFPEDRLKEIGASRQAVDFVIALMKADPIQRLTAAQALKQPWMSPTVRDDSNVQAMPSVSEGKTAPTQLVVPLQDEPIIPGGTTESVLSLETTQASALWTRTTFSGAATTQASAQWTQTLKLPNVAAKSVDHQQPFLSGQPYSMLYSTMNNGYMLQRPYPLQTYPYSLAQAPTPRRTTATSSKKHLVPFPLDRAQRRSIDLTTVFKPFARLRKEANENGKRYNAGKPWSLLPPPTWDFPVYNLDIGYKDLFELAPPSRRPGLPLQSVDSQQTVRQWQPSATFKPMLPYIPATQNPYVKLSPYRSLEHQQQWSHLRDQPQPSLWYPGYPGYPQNGPRNPTENTSLHIHVQPPAQSLQGYAVGPIPSFAELQQRRNAISSSSIGLQAQQERLRELQARQQLLLEETSALPKHHPLLQNSPYKLREAVKEYQPPTSLDYPDPQAQIHPKYKQPALDVGRTTPDMQGTKVEPPDPSLSSSPPHLDEETDDEKLTPKKLSRRGYLADLPVIQGQPAKPQRVSAPRSKKSTKGTDRSKRS